MKTQANLKLDDLETRGADNTQILGGFIGTDVAGPRPGDLRLLGPGASDDVLG